MMDNRDYILDAVKRAWDGNDRATELAALVDLPSERVAVAEMLQRVIFIYTEARNIELTRKGDTKPLRPGKMVIDPDTDIWAQWRDDDGWDNDDAEYDFLTKRDGPGRPANDALLAVHDALADWWVTLGKRHVWRPLFYKDEAVPGTFARNDQGEVFLFVARRCLDGAIDAENCSAVMSRVKDRSRSPKSQAKRKDNSAARGRKHRGRVENPPSQ